MFECHAFVSHPASAQPLRKVSVMPFFYRPAAPAQPSLVLAQPLRKLSVVSFKEAFYILARLRQHSRCTSLSVVFFPPSCVGTAAAMFE